MSQMNRQQTVEALARANNFAALSRFEIGMLPRQTHLPDLHGIERLAGAAFVATGEPLANAVDAQAVASLGDWSDRTAHATAVGSALPQLRKTRRPMNSRRRHNKQQFLCCVSRQSTSRSRRNSHWCVLIESRRAHGDLPNRSRAVSSPSLRGSLLCCVEVCRDCVDIAFIERTN